MQNGRSLITFYSGQIFYSVNLLLHNPSMKIFIKLLFFLHLYTIHKVYSYKRAASFYHKYFFHNIFYLVAFFGLDLVLSNFPPRSSILGWLCCCGFFSGGYFLGGLPSGWISSWMDFFLIPPVLW